MSEHCKFLNRLDNILKVERMNYMSDSDRVLDKNSTLQHPWRRYFARTIDISVISSLVLFPYMKVSGRLNYPFLERILSVLIVTLQSIVTKQKIKVEVHR